MATRIKLKRSSTAAAAPTTSTLLDGEVAVNTADKKIYVRDGSNIVEVANAEPAVGEITTAMLNADITNGQGNTYYVATAGSDNDLLGHGGVNGKHPDTPFLTITKALTKATSGDAVIVAPGEFQETFPLTIPDGVTLRGTNLRATKIKPTNATQSNNAIVLNGDCQVSDLTIKDFLYDSSGDTGYGFVLGTSVDSTTSPYVERVTVTTKGSTVSGSDPYGYAQGDAGRGAKLDGANISSSSQHASVLFNECTFITPGNIGLLATNGIRVEWLNCFNYFASIGVQGIQGATGKYGTGQTRLKLGGTAGTFNTSEVAYQLEDGFQSGTYTRSGSTVTLTRTAHGLVSNDYIYADFISGGALDGFYQVTKVDNNTVTFTSGSGTITTSNVTYKKAVGRGVVASNDGTYIYINGKGTGEFVTTTKPSKILSRFGDTQIDTAQSKFSGGSILFDGTQDNLQVPADGDFGFGTANWTLEAFIRPTSVSGIQRIFDLRNASATDTAPTVYMNGTALHFAVGNTSQINGGTLAINTWYHVAVARSGGTTRLFLDGTELGSSYTDGNDYGASKPVVIGSNYDTSSPTEAFAGNIDEVRIKKAQGSYSGNFTPTTGEFSSDLYTVLLLHGGGNDATTTFTDSSGGTSDIRSSGGDSATVVTTADYSQFGAELRSAASACVYGQKGVQADGAGVKLILSGHNFGYVGSGADYTNDPSLATQANEVEELNSGKVLYSSTDHEGDFRVGDALTVDASTGNVQFAATSSAQSAANITLSDSTGTTNIYPAYIETGNLRLAGNSVTSTSGKIILDPAGDEDITLNGQVIAPENIYFASNRLASIIGTGNSSCAFTVGSYTQAGFSSYGIFSNKNFAINKKSLNLTTGLTITNEGTGYDAGNYQAPLLSNPDQVATATATLATNGAIGDITVSNPGNGLYQLTPDISANLTPVSGTISFLVTLSTAARLAQIAIVSGGAGYSSPNLTLAAPPTQAFDANSAISTSGNTITFTSSWIDNGDQVTYDNNGNSDLNGLSNGTSYYVVNADKTNNTIQLSATSGGSPISLTAAATPNELHNLQGITATATATVTAGSITAITVNNPGSGYVTGAAPALTISETGAGITDASLTVNLGSTINTVATTGNAVYTTTPTLTVTPNTNDPTGSGAVLTVANMTYEVASVTLNNGGYGYSEIPQISFIGTSQTTAIATAVLDTELGQVSSIALDSGGAGYLTAPTVSINGGSGSGAQASIIVLPFGGNILSGGSGYAVGVYQNVSLTGGDGVGATATLTVSGLQGNITTAGTGGTEQTYQQIDIYANAPAATYPVTVANRGLMEMVANGGFTGSVSVGDTATGATSGATATVSYVDGVNSEFVYYNLATIANVPFQQGEVINFTSGGSGTLDTAPIETYRYFIDTGSGAVEAPDLTMVRGNTYRFDMSDSTNTNHPLSLDGTSLADTANFAVRSYGTPGTAGSFVDFVIKQNAPASTNTVYYTCTQHGQSMSESSFITITTGAAGVYGDGGQIDVTVGGSGGVTAVAFTIGQQGTGWKAGDVIKVANPSLIGNCTGFTFTITSNDTSISSLTDIVSSGSGYNIGNVLSCNDADVGEGGGSGFQFTVTKVGYANSVVLSDGGNAFFTGQSVVFDTTNFQGLGDNGSNFALTAADIDTSEVTTIGSAGGLKSANYSISDTGILTMGSSGTTSTMSNDAITTGTLATRGDITAQAAVSIGTTLAVAGTTTLTGNIVANGADNFVDNVNLKIQNGTAAAPSISIAADTGSGFYRSAANELSYSGAGVQKIKMSDTVLETANNLIVDSLLGAANPYFKVDPTAETTTIGTVQSGLQVNNAAEILGVGVDANVPITLTPKGTGNLILKGGTDVQFEVNDGTTAQFTVDSVTGDTDIKGNLKVDTALEIKRSTINNADIGGVASFGEVVECTVSGSGSGYTDGTYNAVTVTGTTGIGTGATFTVVVSGGAITSVTPTAVAKGQNYYIGDTITLNPATVGSGTGSTVTITDTQGQGLVLKPGGGKSVWVNSTGAFVIPSGTTNQRPGTQDRLAGAIRFNSTQQQFEGYNGNDFVSLGGVRDVDQDTYILTEVSPSSDEDTFEFYAQGVNCLSLDKDKFTLKNAKQFDVPGTAIFNGTAAGDPLSVTFQTANIASFRSKKDLEIAGGLRFRGVPTQGTVAAIGTETASTGAYGVSQSYSGVVSTGQFEGTGATFNVTTNGSGNIDQINIATGGDFYEEQELITIGGDLLGGATPANDVTFRVITLSNTKSPFARTDVIQQDFVTRLDSKAFISLDANGSECAWKINRGWNGGTTSYLTVFDSTGDFVELDDCRVEGGQLTSFTANSSITQFDKTSYKGAKTLITIESNDGKVHMLEVTTVCAAAGTTAHATVTNSVTSDNDLVDATIAVAGSNVNISLAKSSAATSSTSFTGRFTTTKVKV